VRGYRFFFLFVVVERIGVLGVRMVVFILILAICFRSCLGRGCLVLCGFSFVFFLIGRFQCLGLVGCS